MTSADDVMRAMLDDLAAGWRSLVLGCDVCRTSLNVAGVDVEVVIAGDDLAAFLSVGLRGLPPARMRPSITVGAFDEAATGLRFPRPPSALDAGRWRGLLREDGLLAGELSWFSEGMLATADRRSGLFLLGVDAASSAFVSERSSPLRRQLDWALGPDRYFLHAGAVGTAEGVALIIGPSGSGKSSTSLACVRAGMGFVSEDYCIITDDPPIAHALYRNGRLADEDLQHFDDFAAPVSRGIDAVGKGWPGEAKALFLLSDSYPNQMLEAAPVAVVIVPEHGGDGARGIEPMSRAQALRLIAPSALHQQSIDPATELAALRSLLAAVPCMRLRLDPDRSVNPAFVEAAIATARAETRSDHSRSQPTAVRGVLGR